MFTNSWGNEAAKPLAFMVPAMSDSDDSGTQDGLTLMIALGGVALLIFLLGIGVIYYLSYVG